MELAPEITEQLAEIRTRVRRDGGATVGGAELRLLCPDELPVSEQFSRIAAIAEKEGWSFAFMPGGAVRFGTYQRTAA